MIAFHFFFTSCSSIKYLEKKGEIKKDEYLLFKQDVRGNKAVAKEKYTPLYQQKPNRKIPIVGSRPYFYFYILGTSFDKDSAQAEIARTERRFDQRIALDSAKGRNERVKRLILKKEKKLNRLHTKFREGNAFTRTFGEAPSIAKKDNLTKTALMMSQMLRAKGYYHNQVVIEYDTSGKKLNVIYRVKEGEPHRINSVKHTVVNKKAQLLVDSVAKESDLKQGKRLDESDLVAERDRLDKVFKNHGYFDFEKQFIFCKIDTNTAPYSADVEILIDTASEKDIFKKYVISDIFCLLEFSKFRKKTLDTILYDRVHFVQMNNKYGKKVIAGKIKFRPGDYYSLDKTISTQLNLTNLDNFKFINVQYIKKSDLDSTLTAEITLNSNKKYQLTDEWGLNVTQGLPGPQGSISFLDRNILRGCENFDASVRYGIEGVASATNPDIVYKSVEAAADVGVTFPQFYIPTKIRFKFNNLYPRSRLSFAFNNVLRPEYSRQNLKLALNYTFTRNLYSRYILSIADFNVVNSTITNETFRTYLDTLALRGNTLKTSFQRSFVSSIHFTYVYNNNDFTKFVNGSFFRLFAESGGTTLHFLENSLIESGLIQDEKLLNKFTYFKFLKFNIDYRSYRSVLPKSQFAFRVNTGVAYPFDGALPYEKYFFAGGSNSVRAWRPRRLGPGSQPPSTLTASGAFDYKFEQPAEIIVEASSESRFKLIKFIEGAVFVDAGNVWRLNSQINSKQASDFNLGRFAKEIAVGSGFGLRLNFTFIIIRFDLGLKVYDPAFPEGERLVVKNWTLRNVFGSNEYGIINLGIGYPF